MHWGIDIPDYLLIAPFLELKLEMSKSLENALPSFNRTIFGIETVLYFRLIV